MQGPETKEIFGGTSIKVIIDGDTPLRSRVVTEIAALEKKWGLV